MPGLLRLPERGPRVVGSASHHREIHDLLQGIPTPPTSPTFWNSGRPHRSFLPMTDGSPYRQPATPCWATTRRAVIRTPAEQPVADAQLMQGWAPMINKIYGLSVKPPLHISQNFSWAESQRAGRSTAGQRHRTAQRAHQKTALCTDGYAPSGTSSLHPARSHRRRGRRGCRPLSPAEDRHQLTPAFHQGRRRHGPARGSGVSSFPLRKTN